MKKIQLTDGLPADIRPKEQSDQVNQLFQELKKCCKNSGLSYVEMNKALYLTDKGLYEATITCRH